MAYHQDRDRDYDSRGGGYHSNPRGGGGRGRQYHDWDSEPGYSDRGEPERDRSGFGRERGFRPRGRGGRGGFHSRGRGHDLRSNLDRRDGGGGFGRGHDDEHGSSYFRRGGRQRRPRGGQTDHFRSIGRGIRRSRSRSRSRSLSPMDGQWFKVTISDGAKHSKDWLFQQLRSNTNIEFEPVSYHVIADKVLFYTQDAELASALKRIDIHTNTGKLSLFVRESEPPRSRGPRNQGQTMNEVGLMEEDPSEVVQDVLAACYDTNSKSLNMENITRNERAKQHNIRGFFADSVMVSIMLNLIGAKCADLVGLNLSGNNISNLNHLVELPSKAPELRELNLSYNRIHNLHELEKIRGLQQLTVLSLTENPFYKRYKDASDYRRDVRAIFPQLRVLDNEQLSDPIIVGTSTISGSIPTCKASFLGPDNTSRIVLAFIENYYKVYDSDKRDDLIMGYDTNSYFSLSVNAESTIRRGPGFNEYIRFSRNLMRCKEVNKRRNLILRGRIDIVHQLRQLPSTQHNPDSFIVDVMCATPTSIVFNIWGVFYESSHEQNKDVMRGFSRTFNICINGDSILIKNDQLTLHQATSSSLDAPSRLQNRESNMPNIVIAPQSLVPSLQPAVVPQPALFQALPVPGVPQPIQAQPLQQNSYTFPQNITLPSPILLPQPVLAPAPQKLASEKEQQGQMVQQLSLKTRLKAEWAEKCLEQNEWNYDHSLQAFRILQDENKIPPDAFN